MNSTLFVVAAAINLAFLGAIIRMVRSRRLRPKYSFLWIIVSAVLMVFLLVPGLLEAAAAAIGIVYAPAMLFLGAIMLLLFIAVHFSWELSRMEDRTRTLVEELALSNARTDRLERELTRRADDGAAAQLSPARRDRIG